jgi:hypothetical protein
VLTLLCRFGLARFQLFASPCGSFRCPGGRCFCSGRCHAVALAGTGSAIRLAECDDCAVRVQGPRGSACCQQCLADSVGPTAAAERAQGPQDAGRRSGAAAIARTCFERRWTKD